ALEIRLLVAAADRGAVERELHDIGRFDQVGRARPREQEAVVPLGVADARMPEGIDNPLTRQNAVRGHKLINHGVKFRHPASLDIGRGRLWTCPSILYNSRFSKQSGVSMAGTDSMHEAPHAGVVRVEKSDVHFSCDGMDTITRAGL